MKLFKRLTLLILLALIFGCTTRITDFTIISTKNVDLSKVANFKRGKDRVVGEDLMRIIIIIPTKLTINVKQAIDNAIQSVPGCMALVDGVVSERSFYFLYGEMAYTVEGTPLIDPAMAENTIKTNFMKVILNNDGTVSQKEFLTKTQFEQMY